METMFAAGRRRLPPVPPRAPGRETPVEAVAAPVDVAAAEGPEPAPSIAAADSPDDGQNFVTLLRSAAPGFAAAAGAQTAVVPEVVPPARHRRSRCRLVLRYADGSEADRAFLGPVGRPADGSAARFDAQIQRWLSEGQPRESSWMVPDDDAADGLAVDVTAWLARS
jgi:hypothetical protein